MSLSLRYALGLPGGGGAVGFDPRSLGNLALWFDASRITGLNDGDSVTTWADLSGHGRDSTQGTAANRPVYKPTAINGHPGVRFDGTNDRLITAAIDFSAFAAMSLYVALTSVPTAVHYAVEVGDSLSGTGIAIRTQTVARVQFAQRGNVGTNGLSSPASSLPSTPTLLAHVNDFALGGGFENVGWIDGSAVTGGGANNTGTFGATDTVKIGCRNAVADFFNGDIGEVLVFTAAHDDATRLRIQAALKAKWGTA